MAETHEEIPSFSHQFDDEFVVGPAESNRAFFGRNVLRGLIEGIDDFIEREPPLRKSHYTSDPAMLGSAMWINDPELISKLEDSQVLASSSRSSPARTSAARYSHYVNSTLAHRGYRFEPFQRWAGWHRKSRASRSS